MVDKVDASAAPSFASPLKKPRIASSVENAAIASTASQPLADCGNTKPESSTAIP